MSRTTTDNTGNGEHNWISQLRNHLENIPTSDGVVVETLPPEVTDAWTVRDCANAMNADFDGL